MEYLPQSGSALIVIAFEGWNDAADAASSFAREIIEQMGLTSSGLLGGEEFYDFQTHRPAIRRGADGESHIEWPRTEIHTGTVPGTGIRVEVLIGQEPAFLWRRFSGLLADRVSPGDAVVLTGALLADTVHTRPIPVTLTSERPEDIGSDDVVRSEYDGPTGILGVIESELAARDLACVSMWAAVPGYASGAHSPKAQLSLMTAFEDLTGLVLEQRDLVERARAWEAEAEEAVADDEELSAFVRRLESMTDAAELPEASGDAIAREFERYLHRRDER